MIEVALVVDTDGRTIAWHLPPGRTAGAIPDSRALWTLLWDNRDRLGGVAHTHPWNGEPVPSHTDVTTFAAIEAALGRRLVWPVVTLDRAAYFAWVGPGPHDYAALADPPWRVEEADELRRKGR